MLALRIYEGHTWYDDITETSEVSVDLRLTRWRQKTLQQALKDWIRSIRITFDIRWL